MSFNFGDIKIIEGPLEPLNVTGESSNTGITLIQPITAKRTYDWDTFLSYIHKTSDSYFDSVKLVNTTADDVILLQSHRFAHMQKVL